VLSFAVSSTMGLCVRLLLTFSCTAFIDGGIELYVPVAVYGQCPPAWCTDGQCVNTYDKHGSWQGEPTFKCWAGADLFFETCKITFTFVS
jgi:hypothetical protein